MHKLKNITLLLRNLDDDDKPLFVNSAFTILSISAILAEKVYSIV